MPNPFEAAIKLLKTMVDDEPKPPLHVGETYYCWLYTATMNEAQNYMLTALNTTTDDELLKVLKKSSEQCKSQAKQMEDFLKKEGAPIPTVAESKPNSNPKDVPLGVKLTDGEIANGISVKTAYAVSLSATAAAQAIRTDVSIIFSEFLAEKSLFGAEMKVLMRKRGWIKVPPYYYPPGMPQK
ncbi:DUF3231 family protein [Virgibacillus siamensis]|uniref:DUF3231 family protein n=1 Tax=Virgibacillus siamensis TaxID=480071 RepID=UPI001FEB542B|nr:DUF3231 family protein [Virgibacillus siamensis]